MPLNSAPGISHTYGASQMQPAKPTAASNAKTRFPNATMQENFYGYAYGKQAPNADYYGKYELDFTMQHQKNAPGSPTAVAVTSISNPILFNHQPKVNDFIVQKNDFHGTIKSELNHSKAVEFHANKGHSFHPNHQNFYNNPNMNNTSLENNQQTSMQSYANQYYGNDYAAASELDAAAAAATAAAQSAYYEQKPHQANFYENVYHGSNSGSEYHTGVDNHYAASSVGHMANENCETF